MKQKNTLLLTGLLAFAALAPMSAQAHGPKHNDGVRLAADIVNLVGASVRLLNPYPVVIVPAPVIEQTPVVIQEPIIVDPIYVPRRPPIRKLPLYRWPHRPRFEPMPGPRFERPHRRPHHGRPMPPRGGRGGRGDW